MIHQDIKHYLKTKDHKLVPIIDSIALPTLASDDVYKDLLSSIVSQQLSIKAAKTIYERFLALFPNQYPHPEWVLALENEQLRSVGLSGQKTAYIKNTALHFQENNLLDRDWSAYDDETIISELTAIKGVGKWTVQMILMFTLKREDVFPIDDLGIQQAMQHLYGLDKTAKDFKKQMETVATHWKPYRSIASRYLWRWKDTK